MNTEIIVQYRPIPGYPWYVVGTDLSVWSCATPEDGGVARDGWHRLAPAGKRAARWPCYNLWREGRSSQISVRSLLRAAFGVASPAELGPLPRGERHGKAKVTDAAVAAMRREAVARGNSATLVGELAGRHGLSRTMVWNILAYRNWRHVAPEGLPADPSAARSRDD